MKITKFESEEAWLDARLGKITGTRLKNLIVKRGSGRKIGFYELIAERLAIPDGLTDKMERGKDLEDDAITIFEQKTGLKVCRDLVIWSREDNDSIALSPDGYLEDLTEAIEVKALGSAYHVKALIEDKIPSEYDDQVIQYFVVNDKLEKLYFVMFDPRLQTRDYICFSVEREEVQDKVEIYLELEKEILKEINEYVLQLSDF